MKVWKKITLISVAICLVIVMVIGISACSIKKQNNKNTTEYQEKTNTTEDTVENNTENITTEETTEEESTEVDTSNEPVSVESSALELEQDTSITDSSDSNIEPLTEADSTSSSEEQTTIEQTTVVETEPPIVETLIMATTNQDTYYIGDTLTASDFTIIVKMSNGAEWVNPPGWSAYPLTLTNNVNDITVVFNSVSTTIQVNAVDRPAAAPATPEQTESVVETPTQPPAPASNNRYWSDGANTIEIFEENYAGQIVYGVHLTFSDYSRFGTYCGNNSYGGYCTTSQAAAQLGAILCINGDYNPPSIGYTCARSGQVYKDGRCYAVALYNRNNGLLTWGDEGSATGGQQLSSLVANGLVSDTMQFGPALVINGNLRGSNGGNRRPRTAIGTNGNPGDIWLLVTNGDLNDGVSYGLTSYECGAYLQSKGCTFVAPLDGGGSSTLVFQGQVINGVKNTGERAVTDFVYFK